MIIFPSFKKSMKGFTLVELMVSLFIMSVSTGLLLSNYPDSTVRLNLLNDTHNLSLLIREAQVRGSSVDSVNSSIGGYGVSISNEDPLDPKAVFFSDSSENVIRSSFPADIISNNVNTASIGEYSVSYQATDAAGNDSEVATRIVRVVAGTPPAENDTEAPVIKRIGFETVFVVLGEPYIDEGATVVDDVDAPKHITSSDSVDTSILGETVITYTAKDAFGHDAIPVTRTVTVVEQAQDTTTVDNDIPTITINGSSSLTVYRNSDYEDKGATLDDDTDGAIQIKTKSDFNTSTIGTYEIVYEGSDLFGHPAVPKKRLVTVISTPIPVAQDNKGPDIIINGASARTISVGKDYVDQGATANDEVDGAFVATSTGTVDTDTVGTYYITYGGTDKAGNSAVGALSARTRTVKVVSVNNQFVALDKFDPTITINGSNPVTIPLGSVYVDMGATANDETSSSDIRNSAGFSVGDGIFDNSSLTGDQEKNVLQLKDGFSFEKLCIAEGVGGFSCNTTLGGVPITNITISFIRPSHNAHIYINNNVTKKYSSACIELNSLKAPTIGHVRSVQVFESGVITTKAVACN